MARDSSFPSRADFRRWLESDRLVSPSTARTYSNSVGTLLRLLPEDQPLTEEVVTEVFSRLIHKSGYMNYRTAWKAFAQWGSLRGAVIPTPRRVDTVVLDPLPKEGLQVADVLARGGVTLHSFPLLKKTSIQPPYKGSGCHILDPLRQGHAVQLAEDDMNDWLALWPTGTDLLFPRTPGSSEPYPTKGLRRALKEFRSVRRERGLLETILAPSDGSALGAPAPLSPPAPAVEEQGSALPAGERKEILAAHPTSGPQIDGEPLDLEADQEMPDPNARPTGTTESLLASMGEG